MVYPETIKQEELRKKTEIVEKYAKLQETHKRFLRQFAPKPEKSELFQEVYNALLEKLRYATNRFFELYIYPDLGLEYEDGEKLLEFLKEKSFSETGVKEINLYYGHKGEQDYIFYISIRY